MNRLDIIQQPVLKSGVLLSLNMLVPVLSTPFLPSHIQRSDIQGALSIFLSLSDAALLLTIVPSSREANLLQPRHESHPSKGNAADERRRSIFHQSQSLSIFPTFIEHIYRFGYQNTLPVCSLPVFVLGSVRKGPVLQVAAGRGLVPKDVVSRTCVRVWSYSYKHYIDHTSIKAHLCYEASIPSTAT